MGGYLLHSSVLSFGVHHKAEIKEKFHKVKTLHIFTLPMHTNSKVKGMSTLMGYYKI